MNTDARILIGIFFASCLGSVVALLSGASWWRWVAAPALLFSGWAALGHLVTLDDDASGGWSSPADAAEAKVFWRSSLVELAAKLLVFGGVVWFVVTDW